MANKQIYDIDGVVFDLGSTLLEYETIPWEELHKRCIDVSYNYLKSNDYDIPSFDKFRDKQIRIRTKYRLMAKKSLKEWCLVEALSELLEYCNIDPKNGMAEKFFRIFYQPIRDQLTLFADTITVLAQLKSQGKKIGLISNTIFPEEYHVAEMKFFQFYEYFDFTIFSVTFGYRKPYQAIYENAIEKMAIEPSRLSFIGDRYIEDVKGPQESGMNAILRYRKGRDYPDPIPDDVVVVKSLTEMMTHIAK